MNDFESEPLDIENNEDSEENEIFEDLENCSETVELS
jgi:hypothetical protein